MELCEYLAEHKYDCLKSDMPRYYHDQFRRLRLLLVKEGVVKMTLEDMLDMGLEIQGRVEINKIVNDDDFVCLFDANFDELYTRNDDIKNVILTSRIAYMYPKMDDYGCDPVICVELAEDN